MLRNLPSRLVDWMIDLGPGAGHDGGRIAFHGTPADLLAAKSTPSGEHLAVHVFSSQLEAVAGDKRSRSVGQRSSVPWARK